MKNKTQIADKIQVLVHQLESIDDKQRIKARKSLVKVGKAAVPALSVVLQSSDVYKARWEATKALGAIGDTQAIPSLIVALEDCKTDVVWLASEALIRLRIAAWPALLDALILRGTQSVSLRGAAHHVLRKQREKGCNHLLHVLRKHLQSGAVVERVPIAAQDLQRRLTEHSVRYHA